MFVHGWHPKKMKLSRKVITHSSFAVFFICEIKKLVTNNKKLLNSYICHIKCPNYQITAIVFFIFRLVREREGWLEVDCTLLTVILFSVF